MGKRYTENRATAVARMNGEPFEIWINDGEPYHGVTDVTPAQVQTLLASTALAARGKGLDGIGDANASSVEQLLASIIDPSERARLHHEFASKDPVLAIFVTEEVVGQIARDLISYLSGVPFESAPTSAPTSSNPGLSSVPTPPTSATTSAP